MASSSLTWKRAQQGPLASSTCKLKSHKERLQSHFCLLLDLQNHNLDRLTKKSRDVWVFSDFADEKEVILQDPAGWVEPRSP